MTLNHTIKTDFIYIIWNDINIVIYLKLFKCVEDDAAGVVGGPLKFVLCCDVLLILAVILLYSLLWAAELYVVTLSPGQASGNPSRPGQSLSNLDK